MIYKARRERGRSQWIGVVFWADVATHSNLQAKRDRDKTVQLLIPHDEAE